MSPKFQLNVYGLVPPDAVAETLMGVAVLPAAGTIDVTVSASGAIVIVVEPVAVFPFMSVTVTETV
jgi:hypothetical protein